MGIKRNRIVVKVGTSTLTNELGNSNLRTVEELVLALADIQNMGNEVILVSSGAIAIGAQKMHLAEKPKELRMKQAAAAVGQCENMFLYDKFFGYYNKIVAQILLNADDIIDEEKKENLANTFETLLDLSEIDGFYDKDPRLSKTAKLISKIEYIDESEKKWGPCLRRRNKIISWAKLRLRPLFRPAVPECEISKRRCSNGKPHRRNSG
jgi:Glutamate 5-kinase